MAVICSQPLTEPRPEGAVTLLGVPSLAQCGFEEQHRAAAALAKVKNSPNQATKGSVVPLEFRSSW